MMKAIQIQIQIQTQWKRQRKRNRHRQSAWNTQHMLYFWNPDDSRIPNMMIDSSPSSSCSRWSPRSPCSGHTIISTGPSVSPFRDFFFKKIGNNNLCLTRCTNPTLLNVIWRVTCLQPAQMFFSTLDTSSLQYQHLFLPISIGGFWKYLSWTIWFQKIYLITIVKYLLEILILADTSKGSNL